MPLPLGHAVIGLLTYECCNKKSASLNRLRVWLFVILLANLPDFDVIYGLIVACNGNAFHRGPTHSLVFALCMGYVASIVWKVSALFPKMSFFACFAIIFSHTLADLLFTESPVSLLWPLEVYWAGGHSDLQAVVGAVLFENYRNAGLMIMCLALILLIRVVKHKRKASVTN